MLNEHNGLMYQNFCFTLFAEVLSRPEPGSSEMRKSQNRWDISQGLRSFPEQTIGSVMQATTRFLRSYGDRQTKSPQNGWRE